MPSTGTLVFNDQKLQAPEMYATESLGVGVSVPTSNLEVTGNAYVSSNLEIGTANLFVDTTTGNVGIGTASPLQTLNVKGNGQNPVIYMTDPTNNRYASGMGTHNVTNVGQRLDFYNGNSGSNGTSLDSSHIRMSINASGDVGIGTTTVDAPLHIHKTAATASDIGAGIKLERWDNYGCAIWSQYHGSVDCMNFRTVSTATDAYGGTPQMVLTHEGRVGIGTTSPAQILHLLGQGNGSGPKIRFETLNNGNGDYTVDGTDIGGIQFAADDLAWVTQHASSEIVGIHRNPNYSGAQGDLVFKTSSSQGSNPTEKMRINHNGNVGIGTVSPSTALDVTGGYGYFRQGIMIGDYGPNGHTQHRTHIKDGSGSQTLYQVFMMKKNNNWIPGIIKVYWAKTNANSGSNAGNYAIWRYYRYSASGLNKTLIAGSAGSITIGYSTAGSAYDEIQITLSGTERIIADIEVSDVYGFIT